MTSVLKLDWTLLMEPNIGSHGLPVEVLTDLREKLASAHARVKARVESEELGFWTLPARDDLLNACADFCQSVPSSITDVLVLGIGGSSLGPRAISDFAEATGHALTRRLHYVDNADPTTLHRVLGGLSAAQTLVVTTSKSGTTVETMAAFLVVWDWLDRELGAETRAEHVVFITDPVNGFLRKLSEEAGVRTLPVPANVGGRFSVLTPVGLLPVMLAGLDVPALMKGARKAMEQSDVPNAESNQALLGAGLHYLMDQHCGANQTILMPYADSLRTLGDWFVQLWGESLGKPTPNGPVGPTPLRAVGSTDQHSLLQLLMEGPRDKAVWFIEMIERAVQIELPSVLPNSPVEYLGGQTMESLLKAERKATALALANEGRPSATFFFRNENLHDLGAFLFLMEAMTAFAGELYGINAFDQPGVEAGKILTNGLMGKPGFEGEKDKLVTRERGLTPFVTE